MTTTVKTVIYKEIQSRNRASLFATPVAWAVADVTELLIQDAGGISATHTGVIVVSDECSLNTMLALSESATQGSVSPLRFAGSSPSIVTGLAALEHEIRGPTLTLTMAPSVAQDAIMAIAKYWINYSNLTALIVISHCYKRDQGHIFKGVIIEQCERKASVLISELCDFES